MELDMVPVANDIASSTTGYLGTFSPVILLAAGLVLAVVVMSVLVSMLTDRIIHPFDEEEDEDII